MQPNKPFALPEALAADYTMRPGIETPHIDVIGLGSFDLTALNPDQVQALVKVGVLLPKNAAALAPAPEVPALPKKEK